jgi:hypothetical protein
MQFETSYQKKIKNLIIKSSNNLKTQNIFKTYLQWQMIIKYKGVLNAHGKYLVQHN